MTGDMGAHTNNVVCNFNSPTLPRSEKLASHTSQS